MCIIVPRLHLIFRTKRGNMSMITNTYVIIKLTLVSAIGCKSSSLKIVSNLKIGQNLSTGSFGLYRHEPRGLSDSQASRFLLQHAAFKIVVQQVQPTQLLCIHMKIKSNAVRIVY